MDGTVIPGLGHAWIAAEPRCTVAGRIMEKRAGNRTSSSSSLSDLFAKMEVRHPAKPTRSRTVCHEAKSFLELKERKR
jgi:hypothetical protein